MINEHFWKYYMLLCMSTNSNTLQKNYLQSLRNAVVTTKYSLLEISSLIYLTDTKYPHFLFKGSIWPKAMWMSSWLSLNSSLLKQLKPFGCFQLSLKAQQSQRYSNSFKTPLRGHELWCLGGTTKAERKGLATRTSLASCFNPLLSSWFPVVTVMSGIRELGCIWHGKHKLLTN